MLKMKKKNWIWIKKKKTRKNNLFIKQKKYPIMVESPREEIFRKFLY